MLDQNEQQKVIPGPPNRGTASGDSECEGSLRRRCSVFDISIIDIVYFNLKDTVLKSNQIL